MVTAAAMGQERGESGAWEQQLRAAKKTALLEGGRRRIHYSFEDGREMIEEYDVITELLMLDGLAGGSVRCGLSPVWDCGIEIRRHRAAGRARRPLSADRFQLRRWRVRSMLGAPWAWETEVGEPGPSPSSVDTLKESAAAPVCVRGETREELWWRVRNVPYPQHVFSVCVDSTNNNLVISTSNHKYYKRLSIPDLDRLELLLDPEAVSFSHKNHTLIVKYQKPARLLDHEKCVRREICTLSSEGNTEDKPQCNTQ
ncbi:protein DPCD isoform X1 [Lethenteron reissneri]|uniref:protein DPCD isoform X1 n=1 Tax=Lethenteron reissneri TaxID=7753 RepID=UPI002AB7BAAF|nr:protein DPCD isoform X1 [Lethenteron reissneri]